MNRRHFICLSCLLAALAAWPAVAAPKVDHVVVVGIDGMTASSVERAKTPNMHKVMKSGAWTLHARSVDPSVSSPNWASMIMGAKPETHGITSNDWKPGDTPAFPTVFGVCHAAHPEAEIAAVYEWGAFGRLFDKGDVTHGANGKSGLWAQYVKSKSNAYATGDAAAAFIREKKPLFTFVHLDLVDHAGHSSGYDTPAYDLAVAEADGYLGQIIQAVHDAGIQDSTALFVVADHGGIGTGHGGKSDQETTVPWMVAGPGIAKGKQITDPVSVAQLAPTITMLLGLTAPDKWTEKPVAQIKQ